ncbi:class I SAM-dependent methyltransferase [Wohlfahrtiimonas larvae]|uniref:rRNA (guanine-N(2)-)-methyltransferase n=1 Tax=Wohlfahrtiimonas larvae TaxID=1157986 RepID=A0ABP9MGN1_9GAMM|nr:class I SAM-dependent methyltransferase [Wohlfahrtiimonas larvae]
MNLFPLIIKNDIQPEFFNEYEIQSEPHQLPSFVWDGEELYWQDEAKQKLHVDFASPKQLWRFSKLNKAQEPILRALKWKNGETQSVWDLTAGLGRDGGMLAYSGFQVTFFERNPVLQVLLSESIHALSDELPDMADRIQLNCMNSIEYLKQAIDDINIELPNNCYLDPMYPHRKKSALVKLDLRMVRDLVGDDPDSSELLSTALILLKSDRGMQRVVVKRPAKSEYLGDFKPNYSIEAPNTRLDVYIP